MRAPNRSYIFTVYNGMRTLISSGLVSKKILGKALGLAQSLPENYDAKIQEYGTTEEYCGCLGHYHGGKCYHRFGRMIRDRAQATQDQIDLEAAEFFAQQFERVYNGMEV